MFLEKLKKYNNYSSVKEIVMTGFIRNKVFVAVAALTFTSAVSAQLEEVLVSAQKRDQSLQDVPIAITPPGSSI